MMASHASKLPETAGIPRPPEIALHSLIFPVKEVFARGKICCFMPLPFSAAALFALEMRRTLGRPLVIITESAALMDEMRRNLDAFTAEKDAAAILDYPPREEDTAGGKGGKPSGRDSGRPAIAAGERLRALARIGVAQSPFLINTCVQALMQKTISPAALNRYALRLSEGKPHDPDRLAAWLEQAGYEFVPEVQEKAQAARRGGLADVWPPSEPLPLRIEFDGLTVESIRRFDAVDQRSCGRAGTVVIPPASESVLTRVPQISNLESQISNSYDSLAQCLPDETVFFWVEKCPAAADKSARQYGGIACHAALHESACRDAGFSGADVSFAALLENLSRRPCPQCFSVVDCSPWRSLAQTGLSPHILPDAFPSLDPGFRALHDMSPPLQSFLTVDAARENRRQWLGRLEEKARAGMDVHLFFSTPGALDRFRSANSPGRDVFHFHLGAVSDGFLHDQLRLAVVSEPGLLFQAKTMRRRAEIKAQRLAERRAVSG
ncbi:MAG: hypothetical protein PHP98_11815, partial [Kiritimatiellae bacterium]|nr:hypothetical protein [Kiritimatiellia bacterium]